MYIKNNGNWELLSFVLKIDDCKVAKNQYSLSSLFRISFNHCSWSLKFSSTPMPIFKIYCIFAGGLYLAADGLLLYTIFGSGLIHLQEESEAHPRSPEVTCDFKTQRIWIFLWLGLNFAAILSLIVGKLKIYKTYWQV